MENKELLDKFDSAVAEMEKKAKALESQEVNDYIKKLKDQRGALIYALQNEDEENGMKIIDITVEFAKKVDGMSKNKTTVWKSFFGGKKKTIVKSTKVEKEEVKQKGYEHKENYDAEIISLREELAKRDVEFEGLKGAYAKMSTDIMQTRKKMEEKQTNEVKVLQKQIVDLKTSLDQVHGTMDKEFASNKEAYRGFGIEILHLAVKMAELETLIDEGDTVTEVDVIELHNAIAALERQLSLIEVQEKKSRLDFIFQMEQEQRKMLKKLGSKADTMKIVTAIKQHVTELQQEIDDRDKKIAADLHIELKSSYYTLSEKVTGIEKALEKAKSKKDLKAIHKKVEDLSKNIDLVRTNEMAIELELQQQHLSDEALLQKIDQLSTRMKKTKDMDSVETADIYKTIEALEMELKARPGTKEVKSMMGSLGYVKNKLDKIEQHVLVCTVCGKKCKNARGLYLHKKMAHKGKAPKKVVKKKTTKKVAKKKVVKKKTAKKKTPAKKKKATKKKPASKKKATKKKPKRLFGIIGG